MPDNDVILIVEDREEDILLMQSAFEKADLKNPVQFVRTGEDAIAYLSGEGQFSNRSQYPIPVLVLLDLKLRGIDGFEVLSWIRQQHRFRTLPVVVLTASRHMDDVNRAYRLGANSFFVKDLGFQQTVVLSRLMLEHWLQKAPRPDTSRRPPKPPEG